MPAGSEPGFTLTVNAAGVLLPEPLTLSHDPPAAEAEIVAGWLDDMLTVCEAGLDPPKANAKLRLDGDAVIVVGAATTNCTVITCCGFEAPGAFTITAP